MLRKRLKQLNFIKNKEELPASSQVESDAPLFGSQAAVLAAETDPGP
jgi:hypothetical protein